MHPRNFFFSSQGGCSSYIEWYDRIFVPRVSRAWNGDGLVMYLLSLRVLAHASPASINFP
nr:unnamed protein product [Callosobruchus chinensis]